MGTRTGSRLGAASGIAFVVALMVADGVEGESTYGLAFVLLALALFFPFLGYLWSVLRAAEGPGGWLAATALSAGIAAMTINIAGAAPELASREASVAPGMRDALSRVEQFSAVASLLPFGVCMACIAIVILRSRVLPAWLGWTAALAAGAMVGNGLFPASAEAPAFLAFMLWTLVAAIVLLRRAMARVNSHVDPVRLSAGAPLPPAVAAAIRGDDPPR